MDKQEECQEFTSGKTITLKMSLTPEQHNMMKEWSLSVPTLYMLDICVVNATKLTNASLVKDHRKAKLVNYLRELDRPANCFSYFFALMEKVSYSRGIETDEDLERNILSDLSSMRDFFKNARVGETDDFVLAFLKELRGEPIETKREDYLNFLNDLNNKFKLSNSVTPKQRLKKAAEIIERADNFAISKQHPVVIIGLACLYGNLAAKKLMKFKAAPQRFDAENALADIMLISRFAGVKLEIEQMGRNGTGYPRSDFITDDNGLIEIIKCFKPSIVKHKDKQEKHETQLTMTVDLKILLTEIQMNEYKQILDLLIQI
jgi:hypothetical protein